MQRIQVLDFGMYFHLAFLVLWANINDPNICGLENAKFMHLVFDTQFKEIFDNVGGTKFNQ